MAKCKKCGEEIDASAKVCPNCGAKRNAFISENRLLLGIIAAFSCVGILCIVFLGPQKGAGSAAGKSDRPTSPISMQQPKETESPYRFGISYQSAKVWKSSIGSQRLQTIVEIVNIGTENLYLSNGAYDLEDSDGKLVKSRQYVSAYPDVIAPGERGYMYEETSLDDYSGGGDLTVVPRPDVREARVALIRYDVTDISVSDGGYRGAKVMGRVENTTDKADDFIYVVAVFYDESGAPIGLDFTILMETLEAGAKVGFEMSGSLPGDVGYGDIAGVAVYAYPSQTQF